MRSLDSLPQYPPGSTLYMCPLDDCEWIHVVPPVEDMNVVFTYADRDAQDWEAVLSSAVRNYAISGARQTEHALKTHLDTHPYVDYIRTIARLREEAEARR